MNTPELDLNRPIYLFDGVCVLCDNTVQYVIKHERKPDILFVAIQSPQGREFALEHGVSPDEPDTFILYENGVAHFKSDAVIALCQHMRGLAPLLRFGRYIPKPIRDWMYEGIARNRYRLFGKKDECMVPNADNRHRFIL